MTTPPINRQLTDEEAAENYFCNECGQGSHTYPEASPYWLMHEPTPPHERWVWCDRCRCDNEPRHAAFQQALGYRTSYKGE